MAVDRHACLQRCAAHEGCRRRALYDEAFCAAHVAAQTAAARACLQRGLLPSDDAALDASTRCTGRLPAPRPVAAFPATADERAAMAAWPALEVPDTGLASALTYLVARHVEVRTCLDNPAVPNPLQRAQGRRRARALQTGPSALAARHRAWRGEPSTAAWARATVPQPEVEVPRLAPYCAAIAGSHAFLNAVHRRVVADLDTLGDRVQDMWLQRRDETKETPDAWLVRVMPRLRRAFPVWLKRAWSRAPWRVADLNLHHVVHSAVRDVRRAVRDADRLPGWWEWATAVVTAVE